MMGVYFLSSSYAHYISGAIAKLTTTNEVGVVPEPGFMTTMIEKVTGFVDATISESTLLIIDKWNSLKAVLNDNGEWITETGEIVTKSEELLNAESTMSLLNYTSVFTQVGVVAIGMAVLAFILSPILKKWMHGVH